MTAPIRPEVWDAVIALLHEGYNLTEIADMDGMPARSVMTRLVQRDPATAQRIAQARETGWDTRAERVAKEAAEAKDAQLGKLAFDANRWLLAKMNPARYGERQQLEHSGPGGGPITTATATGDLPDEVGKLLSLASKRAEDDDGDLA